MSGRVSASGLRGLSKRVGELARHVAAERERRQGEDRRALALRILGDPGALETALELAEWVQEKEWPGGAARVACAEPLTPEALSARMAGWLADDPTGAEILERHAGALQRLEQQVQGNQSAPAPARGGRMSHGPLGSRIDRLSRRLGEQNVLTPDDAAREIREWALSDPEASVLSWELYQRQCEHPCPDPRYAGLSGQELEERFRARLLCAPNAHALMKIMATRPRSGDAP